MDGLCVSVLTIVIFMDEEAVLPLVSVTVRVLVSVLEPKE
tara:strand:- start:220 stop:339 length:120 start_codon:yes stop_codon:yes gene_type:complete